MSRIAIVGAGPGGLTCARVLQRHGVDVTVYDADPAVDARDPGGTLDLHADTGQIALADAGLLAAFQALARVEDQAKRRLDQHGNELDAFVPDADDDAAPEIDRGQLRTLLADHVEGIRWGHRLVAAVPLGGGRHRLEFADRDPVETDLVIGADGAWSRVRPLLSPAEPAYTGISFLDVRYEDVDRRHPEVAAVAGPGHMFANDGTGRAIITQRNSNGRVRGYLAMRTAVEQIDLPVAYRDWSPVFQPLLTEFDGPAVHRPIFVLPAPLTWTTTPGVTLLGDAAHLMSPFGGFGANLAMLDGAELAHALAEEADVDAAVARYEAVMLPRAGRHAVGANAALDRFFGSSPAPAPDHAAEHRRYREAAAGYRAGEAWTIHFRTPRGEQRLDLLLHAAGPVLTGSLDGSPITDGRIDGDAISFTARLTRPFPLSVACSATVDGATMTGRAKASMMTVPFTARRLPTY